VPGRSPGWSLEPIGNGGPRWMAAACPTCVPRAGSAQNPAYRSTERDDSPVYLGRDGVNRAVWVNGRTNGP